MATNSSEIFDLFMLLQSDYRLNTIYISSGSSAFNDYLQPWLLMSIDSFDDICNQSLDYNLTTQNFTQTLTQKNKNILAQTMIKFWLQKEVQDVLQMNNLIQDKDFKTFSAAQNLSAKQEAYNAKREEISQLLVDYGYANNDWTNWKLQNFDAV